MHPSYHVELSGGRGESQTHVNNPVEQDEGVGLG
jgi:hypothetical protein